MVYNEMFLGLAQFLELTRVDLKSFAANLDPNCHFIRGNWLVGHTAQL